MAAKTRRLTNSKIKSRYFESRERVIPMPMAAVR